MVTRTRVSRGKNAGEDIFTGDLTIVSAVAWEMATTELIPLDTDTFADGDYIIFDIDANMVGITYTGNWEYGIGLVHEDDWAFFESNRTSDYATNASKIKNLATDSGGGTVVPRIRKAGCYGSLADAAGRFTTTSRTGIYYNSLTGMGDAATPSTAYKEGRYKVCAYAVTDDPTAPEKVLATINALKVDIIKPYDETLAPRLNKVGVRLNLIK